MNTNMNLDPQIHHEEPLITQSDTSTAATDTDILVQSGFTSDEIMSILWLRNWYQNGGSDRAEVIRHLEFLKLLVLSGKLEM